MTESRSWEVILASSYSSIGGADRDAGVVIPEGR
jgi:hypothetical protein